MRNEALSSIDNLYINGDKQTILLQTGDVHVEKQLDM